VQGGAFAIRESTELLIGMNGNYDDVINGRKSNSPEYQRYIQLRRQAIPQLLTLSDGIIRNLDPRIK
jgi:hypothetical protein